MFCANCGAPSATGAGFCERCGRPMVTPSLSQAAEPVQPVPPEQGRKNGTRILAAIAFVVLVAGVVALFVSERGNSPEEIVAALEQTWVQGIEQRDPAVLREYFSDPEVAQRVVDTWPAGATASLVSIEVVSATDRRIIARVVNRVPSSDPEAAPGEQETLEGYYRYELVATDDGEEWRCVSSTPE